MEYFPDSVKVQLLLIYKPLAIGTVGPKGWCRFAELHNSWGPVVSSPMEIGRPCNCAVNSQCRCRCGPVE